MTGTSLKEKIKAGALVVDVRTVEEFEDEAYPGAINIPVGELMNRLDELGPKDRPIILYCATGSRSALAAKLLKAYGFRDVINAGGLYDMPE
ncbi:MAG: rhodanese-like domain-containing protein [Spirochaetales bacterium]